MYPIPQFEPFDLTGDSFSDESVAGSDASDVSVIDLTMDSFSEVSEGESDSEEVVNEGFIDEGDAVPMEGSEYDGTLGTDDTMGIADATQVHAPSYVLSFDPAQINLGFCALDVSRMAVQALRVLDPEIQSKSPSSIAGQVAHLLDSIVEEFSPVSMVVIEKQLTFIPARAYNVQVGVNCAIEASLTAWWMSKGVSVLSLSSAEVARKLRLKKGKGKKVSARNLLKKCMGQRLFEFSPEVIEEYDAAEKKDDMADAFCMLLFLHQTNKLLDQ